MFASIGPRLRALVLVGMGITAVMLPAFSPVATASAAGLPGKATPTHATRFYSNTGLKVKLQETASADWLSIDGSNLPPRTALRIKLMFANGQVLALSGTRTGKDGGFSVLRAIRTYPHGTVFKVIAFAHGGVKASSPKIVVGP